MPQVNHTQTLEKPEHEVVLPTIQEGLDFGLDWNLQRNELQPKLEIPFVVEYDQHMNASQTGTIELTQTQKKANPSYKYRCDGTICIDLLGGHRNEKET